jgi:twitching motility protein PilT
MRTRDYVQKGEKDGQTLLDAMHDGELEGMQYFDGVLEKMVRDGIITKATAVGYATNAGNLNLSLADYDETEESH